MKTITITTNNGETKEIAIKRGVNIAYILKSADAKTAVTDASIIVVTQENWTYGPDENHGWYSDVCRYKAGADIIRLKNAAVAMVAANKDDADRARAGWNKMFTEDGTASEYRIWQINYERIGNPSR